MLGPREALKLSRRSLAVLVLFGASMFLIGLGGGRVLTYHEVLFAQPAKEMLASGNWLVPTIAGVPSTHKPPLTHWSIAAAMAVFGSQSEWVARLPAVVATILTAVLIAALAARWFGDRVGLLAGLMQVTALYSLQWGRLAECDMLLVAAVTAAMCAFALANVEGPRGRVEGRWIGCAFYAATGVAFLAKGLPGPVFIFASSVLYFLVNQNPRGLRFFWNPPGILIFVVSVVGWPLAAYWSYPQILEDQIMHHFGRYQGELGGRKNFFYYAYSLPMLLLPWTPLVVLAVVRGLRAGAYAVPFWRFVACWFVPGLLLLWTSEFKSKHYAAPLLPGLMIAGALGLLAFFRSRYQQPRLRSEWLAAIAVAACTIAAMAVYLAQPDGATGIVLLIAALAAAILLIFYFELRRLETAQLAAIFGTVWLLSVGVQTIVMPHHDSYRVDQELALRANGAMPAAEPLYLVELPENQVTYYLDHPLRRFDVRDDFLADVAQSAAGELYVLGPEHLAESLAGLGQVEVLDRCAEIHSYMTPPERLTLMRFDRHGHPVTAGAAAAAPR